MTLTNRVAIESIEIRVVMIVTIKFYRIYAEILDRRICFQNLIGIKGAPKEPSFGSPDRPPQDNLMKWFLQLQGIIKRIW